MSNWKLARRLESPSGNLHMETWSSDNLPVGWTTHTGVTPSRITYSMSSPVPYDGNACMAMFHSISAVDSSSEIWNMMSYTVPVAHHSDLFGDPAHTLRASIRCGIMWAAMGNSLLRLFVGSDYGDSNGLTNTSPLGMAFETRLVNSWQLLSTDNIAWTGSAQITAQVRSPESHIGVNWLAVDDLRLIFDEIEFYQHPKQTAEIEPITAHNVALSGRAYNSRFGTRRSWKIPAEFLPSSSWQRVRDWQRDSCKLWLTDPNGYTYPAVFGGKDDAFDQLQPAEYSERHGTLELDSDYFEVVNGPTHGEPMP